jgi:hypothetical protein
MFKVKVENNLNSVMNKIDMLKINVESAVAEVVMSSESEIKDLFSSEYFQNTEIEIAPSSDGASVHIKNLDEDYHYYQNSTGGNYSDIGVKAKEIVLNKIRSKFGGAL